MTGVDYNVDLRQLPFPDAEYDFVFASHVLEHIRDDEKAIAEIRRILRPGGIAILPVPVVADKTTEYPEPSPLEGYHVRAPGFDYFDRYERYFSKVDRIASDALPSRFQPFIYENRTVYPTRACPWRPPMAGEKHQDVVPVCYV
jgi:SAM-dependent methyltransferase